MDENHVEIAYEHEGRKITIKVPLEFDLARSSGGAISSPLVGADGVPIERGEWVRMRDKRDNIRAEVLNTYPARGRVRLRAESGKLYRRVAKTLIHD